MDYEQRSRTLEKPLIGYGGYPIKDDDFYGLGKISTSLFAFLVRALYRFEQEERAAYEAGRAKELGNTGCAPNDVPTHEALRCVRLDWAYQVGARDYLTPLATSFQRVETIIDPWLFPRSDHKGAVASWNINRFSTDRILFCYNEAYRQERWAQRLKEALGITTEEFLLGAIEIVPQSSTKYVQP